MFVNEITKFLTGQLDEQMKLGKFTDEQYNLLDSMIEDIGLLSKIPDITLSVNEFGEKYKEFGGDMESFEKNFKNYARKNVRVRIAQRIGRAVIGGGIEVKEMADGIKKRLNLPLNEKMKDVE